MELKTFIADTINQIAQGIIEANTSCTGLGVLVNPDITIGGNGDYSIPKQPENINITRRVTIIEMDIAVKVSDSESDTVGGKIGVLSIGVNGGHTVGSNKSNESRVKFSVPVALPVTKVTP